jgi:hypothetical protein
VYEDGHPHDGPGRFWQIDLKPRAIQCSSMEQFRAIEIRIGDLRKPVLECVIPDQHYGYFTRYEPDTSQANLSFTMGGSSIFATIGPLYQEDYDALPYEYDQGEIFDVFSDVFNKEGEAAVSTLVFKTFQFANNIHGMGTLDYDTSTVSSIDLSIYKTRDSIFWVPVNSH